MRTGKWCLLVVLASLVGFSCGALLTRLSVGEMKATIATLSTEKTRALEDLQEANQQIECLQTEQDLAEDESKKLKDEYNKHRVRTGWGTMPGLTGSLVGLLGVEINVEEIPLTAVRYGLTKKNILKAVELQLQQHNIKTLYFPRDVASESFLLHQIANEPQLHIEVSCSVREGGSYSGLVSVSMEQYWEYPAGEIEIGKLKKRGLRGIEKTIKDYIYTTTWERGCLLIGKLDDFAEDERDSLEKLVGEFINDYLAANPEN